ncbi:MAG: DUF3422 domain-containing protein [Pseudomonadota bacterium]
MLTVRNHAQRLALNDEVHARPPVELASPCNLSHLAWISGPDDRELEWQRLAALAGQLDAPPPAADAKHYRADRGGLRLRWERHTEFTRCTFIVDGVSAEPFAESALTAVPGAWLAELDVELMAAVHVCLTREHEPSRPFADIARRYFAGNVLVGSQIAAGAAIALTDFRVHDDGFSRLLVMNDAMPPQQAGRMLQRLLEIDTYRLMTLLALPVAQELAPFLNDSERRLASLSDALAGSGRVDEQALLDELNSLEALSEYHQLHTGFRFSAAEAYYDLVARRIDELREQRIAGMQTYREFVQRRLTPALNTCRATAGRQHTLARRIARLTALLSTRVDIARQQQNQRLLESMDRRAKIQVRLQQTVEGLSIAAISYYLVGLIYYLARGVSAGGVPIDVEIVAALSIPLVVLAVALALRRVRRALTGDHESDAKQR